MMPEQPSDTEIALAAIQFLDRVDLKGVEVPAFTLVIDFLRRIAAPPPPPPPETDATSDG